MFVKTLTGEVALPSLEMMKSDTDVEKKRKRDKGIPERFY